ncbi:MAG: class I SAM-dependent methyltransferase, partial [Lysobacter sp.]|nr:class I SAM-dependent methyltransferase [Lysobacter sp.]
KLGSDPLYAGVADALRGSRAALLDLGCGLGLLAHTLRVHGVPLPYVGVDSDANKIALATHAARKAGIDDVRFDVVDLTMTIPAHQGSVALLDVLQYLSADAQQRTLDAAIAMLTPGARLVIRTGLHDQSRRARFTWFADRLARSIGWMNTAPKRYPDAESLRARFTAAGLDVSIEPWYGKTPFNNWRIVATRPL